MLDGFGVTSEPNGIRNAFWVFVRIFFPLVINARRATIHDARNHRCHISRSSELKQQPHANQ